MDTLIIDTSAFVSVILLEPGSDVLGPQMLATRAFMAAPSVLEAHMVLKKHLGEDTSRILREKIREFDIEVVPFTPEHTNEAARAFDRFGKGRHPAGLNFGDCVSYALAQVSGQALLFVGDDFSKTDVRIA